MWVWCSHPSGTMRWNPGLHMCFVLGAASPGANGGCFIRTTFHRKKVPFSLVTDTAIAFPEWQTHFILEQWMPAQNHCVRLSYVEVLSQWVHRSMRNTSCHWDWVLQPGSWLKCSAGQLPILSPSWAVRTDVGGPLPQFMPAALTPFLFAQPVPISVGET